MQSSATPTKNQAVKKCKGKALKGKWVAKSTGAGSLKVSFFSVKRHTDVTKIASSKQKERLSTPPKKLGSLNACSTSKRKGKQLKLISESTLKDRLNTDEDINGNAAPMTSQSLLNYATSPDISDLKMIKHGEVCDSNLQVPGNILKNFQENDATHQVDRNVLKDSNSQTERDVLGNDSNLKAGGKVIFKSDSNFQADGNVTCESDSNLQADGNVTCESDSNLQVEENVLESNVVPKKIEGEKTDDTDLQIFGEICMKMPVKVCGKTRGEAGKYAESKLRAHPRRKQFQISKDFYCRKSKNLKPQLSSARNVALSECKVFLGNDICRAQRKVGLKTRLTEKKQCVSDHISIRNQCFSKVKTSCKHDRCHTKCSVGRKLNTESSQISRDIQDLATDKSSANKSQNSDSLNSVIDVCDCVMNPDSDACTCTSVIDEASHSDLKNDPMKTCFSLSDQEHGRDGKTLSNEGTNLDEHCCTENLKMILELASAVKDSQLLQVLPESLTLELVFAAVNCGMFTDCYLYTWIQKSLCKRAKQCSKGHSTQFRTLKALYHYIVVSKKWSEWQAILKGNLYRPPVCNELCRLFDSKIFIHDEVFHFYRSIAVNESESPKLQNDTLKVLKTQHKIGGQDVNSLPNQSYVQTLDEFENVEMGHTFDDNPGNGNVLNTSHNDNDISKEKNALFSVPNAHQEFSNDKMSPDICDSLNEVCKPNETLLENSESMTANNRQSSEAFRCSEQLDEILGTLSNIVSNGHGEDDVESFQRKLSAFYEKITLLESLAYGRENDVDGGTLDLKSKDPHIQNLCMSIKNVERELESKNDHIRSLEGELKELKSSLIMNTDLVQEAACLASEHSNTQIKISGEKSYSKPREIKCDKMIVEGNSTKVVDTIELEPMKSPHIPLSDQVQYGCEKKLSLEAKEPASWPSDGENSLIIQTVDNSDSVQMPNQVEISGYQPPCKKARVNAIKIPTTISSECPKVLIWKLGSELQHLVFSDKKVISGDFIHASDHLVLQASPCDPKSPETSTLSPSITQGVSSTSYVETYVTSLSERESPMVSSALSLANVLDLLAVNSRSEALSVGLPNEYSNLSRLPEIIKMGNSVSLDKPLVEIKRKGVLAGTFHKSQSLEENRNYFELQYQVFQQMSEDLKHHKIKSSERSLKIEELQKNLRDMEDILEHEEIRACSLERRLEELVDEKAVIMGKLDRLQGWEHFKDLQGRLVTLSSVLSDKNRVIQQLEADVVSHIGTIESLEGVIKGLNDDLNSKNAKLASFGAKNVEIVHLKEKTASLQEDLKRKDSLLEENYQETYCFASTIANQHEMMRKLEDLLNAPSLSGDLHAKKKCCQVGDTKNGHLSSCRHILELNALLQEKKNDMPTLISTLRELDIRFRERLPNEHVFRDILDLKMLVSDVNLFLFSCIETHEKLDRFLSQVDNAGLKSNYGVFRHHSEELSHPNVEIESDREQKSSLDKEADLLSRSEEVIELNHRTKMVNNECEEASFEILNNECEKVRTEVRNIECKEAKRSDVNPVVITIDDDDMKPSQTKGSKIDGRSNCVDEIFVYDLGAVDSEMRISKRLSKSFKGKSKKRERTNSSPPGLESARHNKMIRKCDTDCRVSSSHEKKNEGSVKPIAKCTAVHTMEDPRSVAKSASNNNQLSLRNVADGIQELIQEARHKFQSDTMPKSSLKNSKLQRGQSVSDIERLCRKETIDTACQNSCGFLLKQFKGESQCKMRGKQQKDNTRKCLDDPAHLSVSNVPDDSVKYSKPCSDPFNEKMDSGIENLKVTVGESRCGVFPDLEVEGDVGPSEGYKIMEERETSEIGSIKRKKEMKESELASKKSKIFEGAFLEMRDTPKSKEVFSTVTDMGGVTKASNETAPPNTVSSTRKLKRDNIPKVPENEKMAEISRKCKEGNSKYFVDADDAVCNDPARKKSEDYQNVEVTKQAKREVKLHKVCMENGERNVFSKGSCKGSVRGETATKKTHKGKRDKRSIIENEVNTSTKVASDIQTPNHLWTQNENLIRNVILARMWTNHHLLKKENKEFKDALEAMKENHGKAVLDLQEQKASFDKALKDKDCQLSKILEEARILEKENMKLADEFQAREKFLFSEKVKTEENLQGIISEKEKAIQDLYSKLDLKLEVIKDQGDYITVLLREKRELEKSFSSESKRGVSTPKAKDPERGSSKELVKKELETFAALDQFKSEGNASETKDSESGSSKESDCLVRVEAGCLEFGKFKEIVEKTVGFVSFLSKELLVMEKCLLNTYAVNLGSIICMKSFLKYLHDHVREFKEIFNRKEMKELFAHIPDLDINKINENIAQSDIETCSPKLLERMELDVQKFDDIKCQFVEKPQTCNSHSFEKIEEQYLGQKSENLSEDNSSQLHILDSTKDTENLENIGSDIRTRDHGKFSSQFGFDFDSHSYEYEIRTIEHQQETEERMSQQAFNPLWQKESLEQSPVHSEEIKEPSKHASSGKLQQKDIDVEQGVENNSYETKVNFDGKSLKSVSPAYAISHSEEESHVETIVDKGEKQRICEASSRYSRGFNCKSQSRRLSDAENELRIIIDASQRENAKLGEDIDRMCTEMKVLEDTFDVVSSEKEKLKEAIESLNSKYEVQQETCKTHCTEKEQMMAQMKEIAIEKVHLENSLNTILAERDGLLRKTETLAHEKENLQGLLKEKDEKVEALTHEKENLQSLLKEKDMKAETLAHEKENLQGLLTEKGVKAETLAHEKENLQSLLKEKDMKAETQASEKENLQSLLKEKDMKAEALASEKENLQSLLKEKDERAETLAREKGNLQCLLKERDMKAEVLASEKENLQSLLKEKDKRVETLACEKENLQSVLKDKAMKAETLSHEKENLQSLLKEKVMNAEKLAHEKENLASLLKEKDIKAETLSHEKEKILRLFKEKYMKAENLQSLLKEKDMKAETLVHEKENLQSLLKEKDIKAETLAHEKENLQSLLKEKDMKAETLAHEKMNLQSLLKEKDMKAVALAHEKENLQSLLKEKDMKAVALAHEKENLQSLLKEKDLKAETLSHEKQNLQSLLKEKDVKAEALAYEKENLQSLLKEKDMKAEALASEKENLQSLLEEKDKRAETLACEKGNLQSLLKENDMKTETLVHENENLRSLFKEKDMKADALTHEKENLQNLLKRKDVKAETLANEKENFQSLLKEKDMKAETLAREKENLQSLLKEKDMTICMKDYEIVAAKQALDENESKLAEVLKSNQAFHELIFQKDVFIRQLETDIENCNGNKVELRDFMCGVDMDSSEINALKEEINRMREANEQSYNWGREMEEYAHYLREDKEVLIERINRMESDLNLERIQHNSTLNSLETIKDELKTLHGDLEFMGKLTNENKERYAEYWTGHLEKLQDEVMSLKIRNKELEKAVVNEESRHLEIKEENAQLNARMKDMENNHRSILKEKAKAWKEEMAVLEMQMSEMKNFNASLIDEVNSFTEFRVMVHQHINFQTSLPLKEVPLSQDIENISQLRVKVEDAERNLELLKSSLWEEQLRNEELGRVLIEAQTNFLAREERVQNLEAERGAFVAALYEEQRRNSALLSRLEEGKVQYALASIPDEDQMKSGDDHEESLVAPEAHSSSLNKAHLGVENLVTLSIKQEDQVQHLLHLVQEEKLDNGNMEQISNKDRSRSLRCCEEEEIPVASQMETENMEHISIEDTTRSPKCSEEDDLPGKSQRQGSVVVYEKGCQTHGELEKTFGEDMRNLQYNWDLEKFASHYFCKNLISEYKDSVKNLDSWLSSLNSLVEEQTKRKNQIEGLLNDIVQKKL